MSSRTDPERWRLAKRLLEEALERPETERRAFIAQACGEDDGLRRDVQSLADAASGEETLLDTSVPVPFEVLAPRSRVGDRFGAYAVLDELGRGGMGVVYLARRADDEFQRKVAIKLLPAGLADAPMLERFLAERQILATLDHPHIARLLDGGTTENGEPYFVMEYVEGEPLLDYCEKRELSTRERLCIFHDVCGAVTYAHQNLVVHRDIKPGNILVTADGQAKLLDFGIAKLLDAGGVAVGTKTATLYRMLTPDYASPEQVRGQIVTTSSDVYALGVVLYELLTDHRPYHVENVEPGELLRLVCEEDPRKPSTIAPGRGLAGDLDAIVARAMRKEREKRYVSVAALSEDLDRYLEGLPVRARKGTTVYRAGKFLRRHRFGAVAAALLVLAMGAGVAATLREARRAREAEARAQRRFDDVRRLANSFLFEFHDAIRDLPGATPARALVVKRALEYLDGLSKEVAGDRALQRELADAYQKVGDVQGNPFAANLGDLKGARESYRKSIALLEPAVLSDQATPEERSSLASAYLISSGIELAGGYPPKAVSLAQRGLKLREDLAAASPADVARQMDLAQAWQWLAFDLQADGKKKESAAALTKQREILLERRKASPDDEEVRRSLAQNLYLTASGRSQAGDEAGSLEAFREAAALQESLVRDDPNSVRLKRDLAYTYTELGGVELALSDAEAAFSNYSRALNLFESMAAADPRSTDPILGIGMSRHNLGEALARLGRREEAMVSYEKARPAYEKVLDASPSAWVGGMLATLYVEMADAEARSEPAKACAMYRRGISAFEKISASAPLRPENGATLAHARAAAAGCAPAAANR
jgi:non-specific serine/threonine protein kinase/serine/threonine-protein kinase